MSVTAEIEKLEKELSLKKIQIKSLLTITQAINDNISADDLYDMYRSFLSWEMGISKMALIMITDQGWQVSCHINFDEALKYPILKAIEPHKRIYKVGPHDPEVLQDFDVVIPVYHKALPIAYAIIGDLDDDEEMYNKIQFITTITNIVAVAIENKKLFKRQLLQERFNHEMKLATEVQQMLIPKVLPKEKNYWISKIYMPHSNVGGDYIDYIKFSDDRFAVCIADISGKGVAAAILMANFQAKIQSLIYQFRDLETFVMALNQSVYNITQSDKFITFFIAEINTTKKTLKYINAGHYPPVACIDGEMKVLDKGSTFLGAFESLPSIEEEALSYEKEVFLLSFTDGLAELNDGEGNYFDAEEIKRFVQDHKNSNPDIFNALLLERIEGFKGAAEYSDDIAILTCKVD